MSRPDHFIVCCKYFCCEFCINILRNTKVRAVSKANKSLLHTCLKCESAPKKNWQEILSLEFPPGKGGRGREGVDRSARKQLIDQHPGVPNRH